MSWQPQNKNCWSLVLCLLVCLPSSEMNEEPGFAAREVEKEEKLGKEEWFLSAEADWKAVPLSAPPSVAVILCVCVSVRVSTVSQNRVVDQWRVVEALHIELRSILVRETEQRDKKKIEINFQFSLMFANLILFCE